MFLLHPDYGITQHNKIAQIHIHITTYISHSYHVLSYVLTHLGESASASADIVNKSYL